MKMKMMKTMVLVLSSVLCVSAEVLHRDIYIHGCSDTDKESMYGLDGEELVYADFIHHRGVEPQPQFVDHMNFPEAYEAAVGQQQICQSDLKICRTALKDVPLEYDPPSTVIIYSRDAVDIGQKNTLICHVTGFYPAPVQVHWTKNGDNVTEGTSFILPYPNKDGSFRQTSRLDFVPQQGDVYSCTVGHVSLSSPLTRIWDVDTSPPSVGPAVFCGLGLTVGLLGVAAGTFFLIKGNEGS